MILTSELEVLPLTINTTDAEMQISSGLRENLGWDPLRTTDMSRLQ